MAKGVELGKVKVSEEESEERMEVEDEEESVVDVAMDERWLVCCSNTMKV
jgi:hypothetical protein